VTRLLLAGLALALVLTAPAAALVPAARDHPPSVEPTSTIVSTSGIPHADVGDLHAARGWQEGDTPGISWAWRVALDTVLEQIAAERPDAVLHTGDMVDGRWHADVRDDRVFGRTRTTAQRHRAIRRAGDLYYRQAKRWWAAHDLEPYFGLGDHEVGDIASSGVIQRRSFKHGALQVWKRTWARHFTEGGRRFALRPRGTQFAGTSYAIRVGDVGVVTLDPVDQRRDGSSVRIGNAQLRWLDGVLRRLRRDGGRYLVVQCEVPAIGPNREYASSGMLLENGGALWRVLRRRDVDLLLSAEFHAVTTHSQHGTTPVQVVHGSRMRDARVNYLVIRTFDNHVTLEVRRMDGEIEGRGTLWSTTTNPAPEHITMEPGAELVGTMTIHASGALTRRTGLLREGIDRSDRKRLQRLTPAVERRPPLSRRGPGTAADGPSDRPARHRDRTGAHAGRRDPQAAGRPSDRPARDRGGNRGGRHRSGE
jgi:hypothetical protein